MRGWGRGSVVAGSCNASTQEVQRCGPAWVTYEDPVSRNQEEMKSQVTVEQRGKKNLSEEENASNRLSQRWIEEAGERKELERRNRGGEKQGQEETEMGWREAEAGLGQHISAHPHLHSAFLSLQFCTDSKPRSGRWASTSRSPAGHLLALGLQGPEPIP